MINYQAFLDEMMKIKEAAAAAEVAAVAASAPAKLNLLAQAAQRAPKRTAAALGAAGIGTYVVGKKALDDYMLGRQLRMSQR